MEIVSDMSVNEDLVAGVTVIFTKFSIQPDS
jgi:hypothetical protein